jgi:hypothetical protein
VPSNAAEALVQGRIGLRFGVERLTRLVPQGGVSAQLHLGDALALRPGVAFSARQSDTGGFVPDDFLPAFPSQDFARVSLSLPLVFYPARSNCNGESCGAVQPFLGAGPTLSHDWSYNESVVPPSSPNAREQRAVSSSNRWSPGGVAFIGAEWFVTQHLSLSAQYAVQVERVDQSSTSESSGSFQIARGQFLYGVYSLETETRGWRFGGSPVLLGLTLYL